MSKKLSLNGRHSVTIRMGATHHEVVVDGQKLDLSKRKDETDKEQAARIDRTASDLNAMIFG